MGLFDSMFDSGKRHYKQAEALQKKVLAKEEEYQKKTDEELKAVTPALKEKLAGGADLNAILPDAYAAAREASKRVIGEFPYPVQVLGGVLLHDGDIAEMKTGEGKTLTAVMPIYLNALAGKGAHVVTVNEYLASRDAKWMGDIYRFLGLTVGCNLSGLSPNAKREAFGCDITYTTNSELGFDYLRDNMVLAREDRVLRGLHYAVLDEADSILIDESRTPLIISGPGPVLEQDYVRADRFAKSLRPGKDFTVSKEDRSVELTDAGIRKADETYGTDIYAGGNSDIAHYVAQAMKANYLFAKNVEYVVQDGEVVLVDQFTGRKMEGREYSDGLHQAIQAKEGVGIKQETITLATITYQNFFRLYDKLSGMTGTAKTEEQEFLDTYNMRVYEIPTNKPCVRRDEPDAVFTSRSAKYAAIVQETERLHATGQPVLIGTLSVEINELLDTMLKKKGIPHQILNAKDDTREAEIIAHAGQRSCVTVATNMAGRGTDIKLGEGVAELGGLAVLGSERHEAKRIDNQLRGRAGRQGDPGFSRFYVAMDDDLIEQFAPDECRSEIQSYKDGKGSEEKIRKIIDRTQERAEGLHYDARKNTMEYDNTMMQQRMVIYEQRDKVLDMDDPRPLFDSLLKENLEEVMASYDSSDKSEDETKQLKGYLGGLGLCETDIDDGMHAGKPADALRTLAEQRYDERVKDTDPDYRKRMEKLIFLRTLDREWIMHVDIMEHLKESIHLRGYAQMKPADAYREEGYKRFNNLMHNVSEQTVAAMMQASKATQNPAA
ncbi:MAG: preprotein translocase subunit SecA [Solobacterium sp.]|jgi:preprotein translocase subunit SecA|nr:preprotein translocase subunit SecA [Solobacterium sp.]MCH4265834.1 preprotein translocase subunit SecA [Solobacterium sp.]